MQKPPEVVASAGTAAHHHAHLPRDLLELTEWFDLFYGSGFKRHGRVLNDIARACAIPGTHSGGAHVLVLNFFLPSFSARDIFTVLVRLPGSPQSVEAVAQFLLATSNVSASATSPLKSPFSFLPTVKKRLNDTTTAPSDLHAPPAALGLSPSVRRAPPTRTHLHDFQIAVPHRRSSPDR